MQIYDLIGIGFGPSNLALAIALDEKAKQDKQYSNALFIEKFPKFMWHPDMLLQGTRMQISFLKDLATQRNPASPFTFLNYLHEKQRLNDFINLKTFFPTRHEFNDYLGWAAAHFKDQCRYGEEIFEILPEKESNQITHLRIRSRDAQQNVYERFAKSIVIGAGGTPNVPESFMPFKDDPRIVHSSQYLSNIGKHSGAKRIAVIGAGQSAAEIFMDLTKRDEGNLQVDLITRARSIKPSDDSPFVNEIFNPEYTDFIFNQPEKERAILLNEFMNTNYAAPDLPLIEEIFKVFYMQKVHGTLQHRFLRHVEITSVQATPEQLTLSLQDITTKDTRLEQYDLVIIATGYQRKTHQALLAPLAEYLPNFEVDRYYRLLTTADFQPSIFLQGCCETTHGLSDTLLSVTAVRTEEIGQALFQTKQSRSSVSASGLRAHSLAPH